MASCGRSGFRVAHNSRDDRFQRCQKTLDLRLRSEAHVSIRRRAGHHFEITYEFSARGSECRKTCGFRARADVALIGHLMACPGKRLRLRERVRLTLNFSRQPAEVKLQPDLELPVEPGLADLYDGRYGKDKEPRELSCREATVNSRPLAGALCSRPGIDRRLTPGRRWNLSVGRIGIRFMHTFGGVFPTFTKPRT